MLRRLGRRWCGLQSVITLLLALQLAAAASTAITVMTAGSAQAQTAEPEERAASFRSVSGGVKEDVPGGALTVGAYAIIWTVLFGFVLRLIRMQRSVEVDLARLERSVGDQLRLNGPSGSSDPHGQGTARSGAVS